MSTAVPVPTAVQSPVQAPAPAAAAAVRAVVQRGYGGTEVLALGTAVRPEPGAGEVLVQVHAAGIDRGTWHLMTGRPYLMRLMGFGVRRPKQRVPGLDLAGVVVATGPGTSRFRPGDRVFGIGRGTFAELACAREDKLSRIPSGLGFEEAAVLGVSGISALEAIDCAGVVAGERVLVIGASGGVGTYAVQILAALGAEVTAVCSAAKMERVRALGAAHAVDYRAADFTREPARYDAVLDIGGNTPVSRLRRTMTPHGRLVFVGNEQGGDWGAGMGRMLGALLLGVFVKQRFVMLVSEEHHRFLDRLAALVEAGAVRPVLDRVVGLGDVPAALADLEAGRVTGKIAVRVVT